MTKIRRWNCALRQSLFCVFQNAAADLVALHRLEQRGWLKAEWKESETGREAKFYALTASGRKQLATEKDSWARLAGAVHLIFSESDP